MSEDDPGARFIRLHRVFGDPMTEVYLLFLQSVLPVFTQANRFLQREEPLIHILQQQLISLYKKVLGKYIKPCVLVEGIQTGELLTMDFKDSSNQVNNSDLVIGIMTKQTLRSLHDEGDIATREVSCFYQAVRNFLVHATEYLLRWCPLQDEFLSHVSWIGFENRLVNTFSSVEYIVGKYPSLLTGQE